MFVEFTLTEQVRAFSLWQGGLVGGERFLIALNIGAMGFFWWYLPQHTSRYYEKLIDLDGNRELTVDAFPRMKIDWGHAALTDEDLRRTAICYGMLPHPGDSEKSEPFRHYATGLALLAKSDVHFSFEVNCFHEFYSAFVMGMRVYSDLRDGETLPEAFGKAIPELLGKYETELTKCADLGAALDTDPQVPPKITLSDVASMKMFTDSYFMKTFDRLVGSLAGTRTATRTEKKSRQPKNGKKRRKK
jgi:hypothetical protein